MIKNFNLIPIFLFMCVIIFSHALKKKMPTEKEIFLHPPTQIKYFVFDYNDVLADSLWIRTIQDMDYCENFDKQGRCIGNPWIFSMLNTITELSPKFRIIYAVGALVLSILVNDFEGASKLFDKGVIEYPNDFPILYRAAYHALYEEDDYIKAAGLLVRAGQNGAPEWVFSLASRLYHQKSAPEMAERLLLDLEQQGMPKDMIDYIKSRLDKKITLDKVVIEK